jgi:hypothetical protein
MSDPPPPPPPLPPFSVIVNDVGSRDVSLGLLITVSPGIYVCIIGAIYGGFV